jgi:hypothetical protein
MAGQTIDSCSLQEYMDDEPIRQLTNAKDQDSMMTQNSDNTLCTRHRDAIRPPGYVNAFYSLIAIGNAKAGQMPGL